MGLPPLSPDRPLPPSPRPTLSRSLRRLAHGLGSGLLLSVFPLGRWIDLGVRRFDDSRRESKGLVLVFTGIQGASFLEQLMVLGLADAGFGGRMTIVDWTTGRIWRFASHMRDTALQREAAQRIAARIAEFRNSYPTAPIHLVGYSGGAAVVLQALDELPTGETAIVDRVVLLAAACSPDVSVISRLARTRKGIWHFRSRWDRIFLGLLTRVIGTTDGKHGVAAGCTGFSRAAANHADREDTEQGEILFREHTFRLAWLRQFHYGGHLGYANRVWACETLGRAFDVGTPPKNDLAPEPPEFYRPCRFFRLPFSKRKRPPLGGDRRNWHVGRAPSRHSTSETAQTLRCKAAVSNLQFLHAAIPRLPSRSAANDSR